VATLIHGAYDDPAGLDALADGCDLVTFEFENVPAAVAARLADHAPVFPPPRALAVAQERLNEKRLFAELGIPTAPYRTVDSPGDLAAAVQAIGLPAILKTRRQGYDGKGQRVLRRPEDLTGAWEGLGPCPVCWRASSPSGGRSPWWRCGAATARCAFIP
jgi:5-(carboxyamino)imidazole ribonucleotide synthase